MRRIREFMEAARTRLITFWLVHQCSMCGYSCGFVFNHIRSTSSVQYDSGCDCVTYDSLQPRSWQDVADHYNQQTDPKVIMEMDLFWGFPKAK